jgi:hypothetical protein
MLCTAEPGNCFIWYIVSKEILVVLPSKTGPMN